MTDTRDAAIRQALTEPISKIMDRRTAASGTAVFVDPVILAALLVPVVRQLVDAAYALGKEQGEVDGHAECWEDARRKEQP